MVLTIVSRASMTVFPVTQIISLLIPSRKRQSRALSVGAKMNIRQMGGEYPIYLFGKGCFYHMSGDLPRHAQPYAMIKTASAPTNVEVVSPWTKSYQDVHNQLYFVFLKGFDCNMSKTLSYCIRFKSYFGFISNIVVPDRASPVLTCGNGNTIIVCVLVFEILNDSACW